MRLGNAAGFWAKHIATYVRKRLRLRTVSDRPAAPMVRMTDQLGAELLDKESFDGFTFTVKDDPNVKLLGTSANIDRRKLTFGVQFRDTPANPWISTAGPRGPERLETATHAFVLSDVLREPLVKDREYTVSLTGTADSIYKTVDPKYRHIPLTIGLRLRMADGSILGGYCFGSGTNMSFFFNPRRCMTSTQRDMPSGVSSKLFEPTVNFAPFSLASSMKESCG